MIKKIAIFLLLIINYSLIFAQTPLTIEGTVTNNTVTGTWLGVDIARSVPTALIFRNNSITAVATDGYLLQAGDDSPTQNATFNNLDGEVITGNKLVWNGTDMNSITHGIFTGHNINALIEYNYLDRVPMSIIRKSTTPMTNTSGGVAYNIVRNPVATAGVAKGINNVSFYNNTFYSNLPNPWRGLVDIYTNTDITPNVAATGTKIKNNIFYTVNQIYNIAIHDAGCLPGFESDYNVFYCESGTPVFNYLETVKTFAQWQALGYDTHSVVINPNFNNTTDFVPSARLDYGTDLGTEWQTGLAIGAVWTPGVSPATANQNGKWQVGARIAGAPTTPVIPAYTSSVVQNASPAVLEITFSAALANIIPAVSAFNVQVNSVSRTVNSVAIVGGKVQLTLASPVVSGNTITVAYTKPATNPLQTSAGGQSASFTAVAVTNNCVAAVSPVYSSSVVQNATPSLLEMTYNLPLANIVPAVSSFSVKVNSVAVTISSVAISGSKVTLTLSAPIKFGDILSVSYTKPATNPLQTVAGGTAAGITAQTTVNNVADTAKAPPVTIVLTISPNHVHKIINVMLAYSGGPVSTITSELVRISDISGKLYIEKTLVPGVTNTRIPLNLNSGIYNVKVIVNGAEAASRKMVVY
jgi:uncharacterized repeat protein (TIGR02059 family)